MSLNWTTFYSQVIHYEMKDFLTDFLMHLLQERHDIRGRGRDGDHLLQTV
jgi:hypothetical protein